MSLSETTPRSQSPLIPIHQLTNSEISELNLRCRICSASIYGYGFVNIQDGRFLFRLCSARCFSDYSSPEMKRSVEKATLVSEGKIHNKLTKN